MRDGEGGGGGEEEFPLGIFFSCYPFFHVAFIKRERKTLKFSNAICTRTTKGAVRYLARVVNP